MDRRVAALVRADGPGTAEVAGSAVTLLFGPLRKAAPDRMDRRKVEHVKAHSRDVRQPVLDVAERPMTIRLCRAGPGEDLIPRGVSGSDPIDHGDGFDVVSGRETAIGMGEDHLAERLVECQLTTYGRVGRLPELAGPRPQTLGLRGVGSAGRIFDDLGADQEIDAGVLSRLESLRQISPPGGEPADPSLDRIAIPTRVFDPKLSAPSVVPEGPHGDCPPGGVGFAAKEEPAFDLIVSVGEHVRLDDDSLSGDALDGKATPRRRGGPLPR